MILDGELLDLLEKLAIKAGVSPSERLDEIIKDEYYRINRIVPQELSTDPYWRDHRDVSILIFVVIRFTEHIICSVVTIWIIF